MDLSMASQGASEWTPAQIVKHRKNAQIVLRGLRSLELALNSIIVPATNLCEQLDALPIESTASKYDLREAGEEWEDPVPAECPHFVGTPAVLQAVTVTGDEQPLCPSRGNKEDGSRSQRPDLGIDVADDGLVQRPSSSLTNPQSSGAITLHPSSPSTPLAVWTSTTTEEVASHWKMMSGANYRRESAAISRRTSTSDPTMSRTGMCDWMVHPLSAQRIMWDVLSVVFIGGDVVLTPLQFAFGLGYVGALELFRWLRACFWTFDILMSFRTAYLRRSGKLEGHPKLVARHYLRSWFFVDVGVATLEWLGNFELSELGGVFNAWRFNRMVTVARTARLLRFVKMPAKLHMLSETLFSGSVLLRLLCSMLKMGTGFMVMVHLLSCGWYIVGSSDKSGWVYTELEGGVNGGFVQRYVSSARWVLAQVNGRTDQEDRRTMREQMYIVACGIIAILFMSLFISGLTTRMVELQRPFDTQEKEMRQLNRFFDRNRSISLSARHIAKHYVEARGTHHNTAEDEIQVLNMLPEALKQDLLVEMRSPCILSHFVIRNISRFTGGHLIHTLCKHMHPVVAASMTMIFVKDEPCSKVIIVERGECIYSQKGRLKKIIAEWLEETVSMDLLGSKSLSSVANSGQRVKRFLIDTVSRSSQQVDSPQPVDKAMLTDDMQIVRDGAWLSEAALWVHWETRGDFLTASNLTALAMEANTFQEIVRRHQELLPMFAVFAWAFLSNARDGANRGSRSMPLSPYCHSALGVSDFIDETERARLYDIDVCPAPPVTGTVTPQ